MVIIALLTFIMVIIAVILSRIRTTSIVAVMMDVVVLTLTVLVLLTMSISTIMIIAAIYFDYPRKCNASPRAFF